MTMLEELRRSGIRQLLIVSVRDDPVPPDLKDPWSSYRHGLFDGLPRFDDIFHGVLLLVCDSSIAASS